MKIVCVSDLHGFLPEIPECDLCLIAGDLCPSKNHNEYWQMNWLNTTFKNWYYDIPCKQSYFIAGNHDFGLQNHLKDLSEDLKKDYLQDNIVIYENLVIYGTPWIHNLPSWAFNISEQQFEYKLSLVSYNVDIVLAHSPPFGILDKIKGYSEHMGSHALRAFIEEKGPAAVFCGHIHEEFGSATLNKTKIYNCSIRDEQYNVVNPPTIIEL